MSVYPDDNSHSTSIGFTSKETGTANRRYYYARLPDPGERSNASPTLRDDIQDKDDTASQSSFFHAARQLTTGGGQFNAARVINNNYYHSGGPSRNPAIMKEHGILPSRKPPRGIKEIDIGDIVMKTEQSSNGTIYVNVKAQSVPNGRKSLVKVEHPLLIREITKLTRTSRGKVTRTIQIAEIPQLGMGECTVVQFEANNPDDAKAVEIAASEDLELLEHTPPAIEYHGDVFHSIDVYRYIPDFVGTVLSLAHHKKLTDISDFVKTHPSVIFGTVIHLNKPGIVYRFHPSPLSNLEWYYRTNRASLAHRQSTIGSELDHGRLSLTFGLDGAWANFGIHAPPEPKAPAYLSQASLEDEESSEDLVLVDTFSFYLCGKLTADPSTFSPPVYLFHRKL
ncbi:hypothetical protein V5O48_016897 [Marasmius crinis-equi]|uniref:Uncharacterized protein n=1 Tax=Marasmius crinis-equi TaxID=585013 RepID=A0ABR3EQQ1_9AGAR